MMRYVQDAKEKVQLSVETVLGMASVHGVEEMVSLILLKVGGVLIVKVQANVVRVKVKVCIRAENVEVQGFSCIGRTIS